MKKEKLNELVGTYTGFYKSFQPMEMDLDTIEIYRIDNNLYYNWRVHMWDVPGYLYSSGTCTIKGKKVYMNSFYDKSILTDIVEERIEENSESIRIHFDAKHLPVLEHDCNFIIVYGYRNGQERFLCLHVGDKGTICNNNVDKFDYLIIYAIPLSSLYNLRNISSILENKEVIKYEVKDTLSNFFIIKNCDKLVHYMFFENFPLKVIREKNEVILRAKGSRQDLAISDSIMIKKTNIFNFFSKCKIKKKNTFFYFKKIR